MKAAIFTLATLFLVLLGLATRHGFVSGASAQMPITNGKDLAYKVCSGFSFESDRTACTNVVGNSYEMNLEAVGVCSTEVFPADMITCFTIAKNKHYQPSIVGICKSMRFTNDQQNCLNQTGNKFADEGAIAICKKNLFPNDMIDCLKKVMRDQAPAPSAVNCKKDYVMAEFDEALRDMSESRLIKAFHRFNSLKTYLQGCMQ